MANTSYEAYKSTNKISGGLTPIPYPGREAPAPTSSGGTSTPPTSYDNTKAYGGIDPGTIDHAPFLDYGRTIMEMALDPQGALRAREEQRMQDMIRAGLETRGLNKMPVGQGLETEGMSDFVLDWNDRILNRASTGANAFLGLGGMAQNIADTGFRNSMELGRSAWEDPNAGTSSPTRSTIKSVSSSNTMSPYEAYKKQYRDDFMSRLNFGNNRKTASATPPIPGLKPSPYG